MAPSRRSAPHLSKAKPSGIRNAAGFGPRGTDSLAGCKRGNDGARSHQQGTEFLRRDKIQAEDDHSKDRLISGAFSPDAGVGPGSRVQISGDAGCFSMEGG